MTLDEQRAAARKALDEAFHVWLRDAQLTLNGASERLLYTAFRAGWRSAGHRSTLTDRVTAIDTARAELQAGDRRWITKGGNA